MPSLAISNIAWPREQCTPAFALLAELTITQIEIAPLNVLPAWDCDLALVRELRTALDARGISCVALQGVFAGVNNADLFIAPLPLLRHLERVARIASILGARACVFGAPKLRQRNGIEFAEAFELAVWFLRRVGPIFADAGCTLTFEAVSARYGCDFITTTRDAITLVEAVAAPGIGLQIDTGTIFDTGESTDVIARALAVRAPFHVHISEPELAPIGTGAILDGRLRLHLEIAAPLNNYLGPLSIEMRATPTWQRDIRNAVSFVRNTYCAES